MTPDSIALGNLIGTFPKPPKKLRSCNRHNDCDAADERAREQGRYWASHCHNDCCEDCFGS